MKRKQTNIQHKYKKILNMTSYHGIANQNHNITLLSSKRQKTPSVTEDVERTEPLYMLMAM